MEDVRGLAADDRLPEKEDEIREDYAGRVEQALAGDSADGGQDGKISPHDY